MTAPFHIILRCALMCLPLCLALPADGSEHWADKTARNLLRKISEEARQLRQLSKTVSEQRLEADTRLQDSLGRLQAEQEQLVEAQNSLADEQRKHKGAQDEHERLKHAMDSSETLVKEKLDARLDTMAQQTRRATQATPSQAQAIAPDGTVMAGTRAAFGPYAFFQPEAQDAPPGLLRQVPGQALPQLFQALSPEQNRQLQRLFQGNLATPPLDPTGGKAMAVISQSDSPWQHLRKGGVIMLPLAAIALVALVAVVAKSCQLARLPPYLTELEAEAQGAPHLTGDQLEERLFLIASRQAAKLERFLSTIAVCASAAPLLGLLGTVTGMIHTFSLITVYGTGDPRLLSAGISEALITTETGLAIAIPAILAHVWLSRKLKRFRQRQQQTAIRLVTQRTAPPQS